MTWAMGLPLVAGAVLGGTAPRLAHGLPPATAVRLLTAAMLLTALATGFVLCAAGALVLGQVPLVAALGHWSARALGSGLPIPAAVGWAAGITVCGLLLSALHRCGVAGRDLVRAALTCRRLGPAQQGGLVVVDDVRPEAYSLPGLRGRVVVSTAMLRALPADERRVLLAHEAAHLRHRHHLWVQAAELAAAADPLLRPGARAVRTAVERWADEVAAGDVGDRPLAARALARAGLARAGHRRPTGSAALAGADTAVADRARALLAGPPRRRRGLTAGVAVLALATAAAVLVTAHDTDVRFDAAHSAYAATDPR